MGEPTLSEILEVAQDAAYLAGKRTLAYFNAGVQPDFKADDTPVTVADREAERVLRERILQSFPDHAILGEEEGESKGSAPYRWVVDPIDGTKAFVAGVPLYGVLIGVEREGVPIVGVIYLPPLGDMVSAATGLGCHWNGRPCRVSETKELKDALVVCSSIRRAQKRSGAYEELAEKVRLCRTWGDAFGYAMVATGRAEVMLDPVKSPWDVGPMPVILAEAGGCFSTWKNEPTIYGLDGLGTNGHLHEQVVEILSQG
jgi:histidinol phosphatase-like enzyme (inositol monophosphatase family)